MHHDATRSIRLVHPPSPDDPGVEIRAALQRHEHASRALLFWAFAAVLTGIASTVFAVLVMRGGL